MQSKSVKTHKKMPKRRKKRKINLRKILLVFFTICISLCLILYPYVSNYIFENRADGIVEAVEEQANSAEESRYADDIEAAKAYNENLATGKDVYKRQDHRDEVKNFIILDDDFSQKGYARYGLDSHLIQTVFFTHDLNEGGLQEEHKEKARKIFSEA